MRKLMHRSEGFTLIELMIVILIIAILVAIAVPVYLNSRANAQKRTCQANIRTVDGAIEAYAANRDDGSYPSSYATLLAGNVLKKQPFCPAGSTNQSYVMIGANPPAISCPVSASHTI